MLRFLYMVLLATLSSCCARHGLPDPLIEDPAEMVTNLVVEASGETFYGETRVEYYGEGKARKGKLVIMALPPDSIRMEVLSFTDDLLSVLTVKSGAFVFFERGGEECYVGPLCAAPLVSKVPLASDPSILIPLLHGSVPVLEDPERSSLEFSTDDGVYVLELWREDTEQEIRIRPDGRTVGAVRMQRGDNELFRIQFDGEFEAGQRVIPKRLRLQADDPETDLSIEYRDAAFGLEFKGDPFLFECPQGTAVRQLYCPEE